MLFFLFSGHLSDSGLELFNTYFFYLCGDGLGTQSVTNSTYLFCDCHKNQLGRKI